MWERKINEEVIFEDIQEVVFCGMSINIDCQPDKIQNQLGPILLGLSSRLHQLSGETITGVCTFHGL